MPEETSAIEAFYAQVTNVSDFIWGGSWNGVAVLPFPPMVIALFGVGLWMMFGLRFYPITHLGKAFVGLFKSEKDADAQGDGKKGEISPFAALSTALSGQVGTGNLAGVATAITLGGPGALFWMWVTALIGMALAFAEGALAIRYREQGPNGDYRGGPMTYIRLGLGKKWGWLAGVFCVGALFSSVTTGNMIQANSVADSIHAITGAPDWVAGLIVAAAVFAVIIGGIKSIGSIAEKVVPAMALAYVTMAVIALILNFEDLPGAFAIIFESAFTGHAAAGGFVGAGMIMAIRAGVARGLFSNEAGQGSTPIAHAVAQTEDPARQGRFAMMGTFIDTLVICTATGLVLLTVQGAFPATNAEGVTVMQEHVWSSDLNGFAMTEAAYSAAFPMEVFGFAIGGLIASVALILFVFTTLLTWSYYGERAVTHLFGDKLIIPFRLVWVLMIFIGSFQEITFVWRMGDIANASMALPNLVALALLSGVVFKLAKGDRKAGPDHD
ncbi:MAG: sodium:alanine symporter family protein [Phenylobacterium sp.]|uniref:alanine/glycine:cation symporter family protein n=1 Tax=Phenylobacterium sp. TaxID=1871053 RepID=UPI0027216AD5|nr:sodium:alanine symporter family protein [Phenylobacterium sp.]MDO8901036.1 sodium:alanine symporter family protein [Phenylobacterium sp.]MDP2214421.1 sodium:alanine symporter family protein [Phenylobacterium sp.]